MTPKPLLGDLHAKPERPEKRKRMTIAAGFVCSDGVVICADSEETQSYIRTSIEKLITYDEDWCKAAAAGSGNNGDLIDALIERVFDALDANQPETVLSTKHVIQEELLTVHEKEIAAHPGEDKLIDLLIAIKPKNAAEALLWKTSGPVLRTENEKEVIGSGVLIKQVAEHFYREDMPVKDAVLLAANILYQAKHHVRGCGGWSRITAILNSGMMESKQFFELNELEEYLSSFETATKELFFSCGDPDHESFGTEFEKFRKKIFDARQSLIIGYDLFRSNKDKLTKKKKKRKR